MHADRIGIDDVAAFAVAKTDKSELLLEPAKEESERDADEGTDETYHATFHHKDATNLVLIGTKVA